MRYYFAGAYARRAELLGYAKELNHTTGAIVTSRWLDEPEEGLDAGFGIGSLEQPEMVEVAWKYGRQDLADLLRSDVIVSFTGQGGRGGRHIEHGFALAFGGDYPPGRMSEWPIRIVLVGPREHVFHCHPATEVYADFEAFRMHEMHEHLKTEET